MTLTKSTRKELKSLSIKDFKEGDLIDIVNENGSIIYTIHVAYGEYSSPLKTRVSDASGKYLSCTAGCKGGWPYYIAGFIHSY